MIGVRCLHGFVALGWTTSVLSCAMDAGTGFATLDEASLEISLDPGRARDLGDGTVLTDEGYEVEVQSAVVRVERMELQEVRGGTNGERFDPADPPPGYSLCHSGHCHRDDGALVDYEDIEVELAGGAEAFSPLVTLEFNEEISMLTGRRVVADTYTPSEELPRSTPRRVVVIVSRIEIEGTVSGGNLGNDSAHLTIGLPLRTEFDATIEPMEIDRHGPERVTLSASVSVDGTLFDGIDFAAIEANGRVVVDDPDDPAALLLGASFAESETTARLH
jgi:hypothetical protein